MQADYVLSYHVLTRAQERNLYLMARIKGHSTPASQKRRLLNIAVVLDRSGSMRGTKIEYVQQAASFLVDHLTARDTFSLVSYDNLVEVNVEPTAPTRKQPIHRAIKALKPRGATNLSGGWLKGCQLVDESRVETGVNRVLLLTDGLANQGITSTARLKSMARQKRDEGVTTTTMGVGMDFNEDLLQEMASEGGGAFYFIDDPDQTPVIFQEELTDLLSVVGQNLTITLTPTQDVTLIRQWNTYPSEHRQDSVVFNMADLFADEEKLLLLELRIPGLQSLGETVVATLRFEYDELQEEHVTHQVIEVPVKVNVVPAEDDALEASPDQDVVKQVLLLQAARARDEAIKHADERDYKKAQETLSKAAANIKDSGLLDDDDLLREEHNQLREEAVDMEFGDERYDAYARKSMTSTSNLMDRTVRYQAMRSESHVRHKSSRPAIERGGDTPTTIEWDGNTFDLEDAAKVRIGRAEENDIVVDEVPVSKHHCTITRSGDDLLLTDQGSTNGTFANGGIVEGEFRLSVGDVVTVGKTLFTFS